MVLLVLAIAEFLFFVLAATQVDVLLLMLFMAAVSAWGVVFLFRQTADVVQSSLGALSRAPGGATDLGDRGMRLLAGVLLVFPGFLTGAVGGLLLLSPVRAAARPVVGSRLGRLLPPDVAGLGRAFRRRDVLDVVAVPKDPEGTTKKPAPPPELR